MKLPHFVRLLLAFIFLAVCARGEPNPPIVPLGQNTYSITRAASHGFTRDTEKLKNLALEEARAFCAKQGKEMKVISATKDRPTIPLTGFASAKVVFKALDAGDPELYAPVSDSGLPGPTPSVAVAPAPRSETDALYADLVKLDDLRKKGILTEEEFQAQKKKLLEKSN